jgi:hypothetical protein
LSILGEYGIIKINNSPIKGKNAYEKEK